MVTTYEGNNVNHFPMEVCFIVDNQHVKLSQLKRTEIEAMIKVNIFRTRVRFLLLKNLRI